MGRRTRPWYRLRWTDVVAAVGLGVFVLQAVDRFTTGQTADPLLTPLAAGLATGAAIGPRALEWARRSAGGSAASPPEGGS